MKKTCIVAVLLAISLLLPSCQTTPQIDGSKTEIPTPYESPSLPIESAEPTEPSKTPSLILPTESTPSDGKYTPLLSDFVISKDLNNVWDDSFSFEFSGDHPLGSFRPLDYSCTTISFGFSETVYSQKNCWIFGIPESIAPTAFEKIGQYPEVRMECNYTIVVCYREESSDTEYRVATVTPEYPGSGPTFPNDGYMVLFGIPQDCLDLDPDKNYECVMFLLSEKNYSEDYLKPYIRLGMDSYYEAPFASGYLYSITGDLLSITYTPLEKTENS